MKTVVAGLLIAAALSGCGRVAVEAPVATSEQEAAAVEQRDATAEEASVLAAALTAMAEELGERRIVVVDSDGGYDEKGFALYRKHALWAKPLRGAKLTGELFDLCASRIVTPVRYEHVELGVAAHWVDAETMAQWEGEADMWETGRLLPERFEREHRGAEGVMIPTVVAFSRDRETAVTFIARGALYWESCGNCQGPADVPWFVVAKRSEEVWNVTSLVAMTM